MWDLLFQGLLCPVTATQTCLNFIYIFWFSFSDTHQERIFTWQTVLGWHDFKSLKVKWKLVAVPWREVWFDPSQVLVQTVVKTNVLLRMIRWMPNRWRSFGAFNHFQEHIVRFPKETLSVTEREHPETLLCLRRTDNEEMKELVSQSVTEAFSWRTVLDVVFRDPVERRDPNKPTQSLWSSRWAAVLHQEIKATDVLLSENSNNLHQIPQNNWDPDQNLMGLQVLVWALIGGLGPFYHRLVALPSRDSWSYWFLVQLEWSWEMPLFS